MSGWLIDTFIYTGVLIGAVLLLRRPVGRVFGPQLAYALWALPFLRLLLPPIVLPADYAPEAVPAAAPEPMSYVDVPESAATLPLPATQVEPAGTAYASVEPGPVEAAPPVDWTLLGEIAVSVWVGGALAFLAWRIVTYRRMRRELLAEARPVGEIGKIRLVETPALGAPVAFGVIDKVIALPPLFMAQPDLTARDLAIEHELAHHRGNDLLANFAAQALLALHWANPLAWYGWRAMRRDQEAACDARVIAGRTRDERARYAALIAGTAAGPRLALAAPMACPVLGERSIVHRLRSLSMSERSLRRRWLGRALVGAGALALPLTASISYTANAQAPEPPAPPSPLSAPLPPDAPAAPDAPDAPEAAEGGVQTFVLQREVGPDGEEGPIVRQFTLRRDGDAPMPRPAPHFEFHAWGDPDDPEFEARMKAWEKEMEKWGEDMEEWGEEWGESYAEQMREQAEQGRAQALAWADAARVAPVVVQSCDENERARTTTSDGRQRVVICQREIELIARSSLRQARASIAANREISDEVRREVLEDLDQEIARIESGRD